MSTSPDHQAQFWTDAWSRHLETYLDAVPRTGIWLERVIGGKPRTLELAGGSCRDSRYLFQRGWDATGSDFDDRTLAYLRQRFAALRHPLLQLDAFATGLPDRAFDLTFHNGLLIYFHDDAQIHALLHEQARITRETMIMIVHNALHLALRHRFAQLSASDPLYDVRFFTPSEIVNLVRKSGIAFRALEVRKFGGRADAFYRARIKGLPNPLREFAHHFVPRLYALQSWSQTERIAVIVRL
jgi:hypothetical protein